MNQEEGENLLRDNSSVRGVIDVLTENPEKVKSAMVVAQGNKAVRRFANTMRNDDQIVKNVMGASMSDKKRIYKAQKNAGNTRQTSGIFCVLITPSRQGKKVFYPPAKDLELLKEEMLDDIYGCLYSEEPDRTNKLGDAILKHPVLGSFYLFKKENDILKDLSPAEVEQKFPGIVNWKCKL